MSFRTNNIPNTVRTLNDPTVQSFDRDVNYKVSLSHSLVASKGLVLGVLFSLPVRILRIVALAISIFGNWGKNISSKIDRLANKLHAIHVVHHFHNLSVLLEPDVLCRVKNLATKNAIWNEEDLKKSKEYIELMVDEEYCKKNPGLNPENLETLKKYQPIGAQTDGICFGASLWVIKQLRLRGLKTESELIQFFDQYKDGFPAEAAGLQNLHRAFIGYESELSEKEQEDVLKEVDKAKQEFFIEIDQKREDLLKQELSREERMNLVLKQVTDFKESMPIKIQEIKNDVTQLIYYKNKISKIHRVASLIDLKLRCDLKDHAETFFTAITCQKVVQEKFNKLENDYYQLLFKAGDKGGHSTVYIKMEFGSYILDPNFGLIKCDSNDPAKTLCELFKRHYKGKITHDKQREQFLEIYRYSDNNADSSNLISIQ